MVGFEKILIPVLMPVETSCKNVLFISPVPQPKSCEIDKNKNICQNGGTCQDLSHGRFKCLCTEKFTGIHCQESKDLFYYALI